MAGQSRAAQRRGKQKKKQPSSSAAPSSTTTDAKKQQKQAVYASDGDSEDDDQFGDAALAGVLPLKSLEESDVRDFVSELEQKASSIQASKKANKRTRAEIAQHEIDKKKKRYREDKAQKIVWRKFDRENRTFEQYYQDLLQLPAAEWDQFVASLKEPTPIHVRVNGECILSPRAKTNVVLRDVLMLTLRNGLLP